MRNMGYLFYSDLKFKYIYCYYIFNWFNMNLHLYNTLSEYYKSINMSITKLPPLLKYSLFIHKYR